MAGMGKYSANTDHAFLKLPDITLGVYNCHDAYNTARLVKPLFDELRQRGNFDYATQVMEPLQTAVIHMQSRGLLLDKEALKVYRTQVRQELEETDKVILAADPTKELWKPTPTSPNSIGSPKKLSKFLFTTLGLKKGKKTDSGFDSTDQESLYRILRTLRKRDEQFRPVVEALFHRSRLKTIYQRYLNLDVDPDGRVRAAVKMYGTKTMRFAYAEPALQQFPPEARHIFIAAPDHSYLSVDYSQLEARILAYLSGDTASTQVFERDHTTPAGDVHRQNASDLFEIDPVAVTKPGRNFAKTFLYGISYGGAVETMKTKLFCPCQKCAENMPDTLHLTRSAMKQAETRWHQIHHAVAKFQRDTASFVRKNHHYSSPLGAKRWIAKPWGTELDRELKNLPMQFGGALLMNERQVRLNRLHTPIIMQHHDSFLLEVPDSEIDEWAVGVKAIMEAPCEGLGTSIPIDIEVGKSWGALTKWKGPRLGGTSGALGTQLAAA
jgi:DNA polymerase-1